MASSFTQIYIHAVFAVKFRAALIMPAWEAEMYRIMGGKLRELGHSPIALNGVEDHVHLLWRHNRTKTVSYTLQKVKGGTSHWINEELQLPEKFRFQHGYGAFTVSPDRVPKVEGYVWNQKNHHKNIDLCTEYDGLLIASGLTDLDEFRFDPLC